MRRFIPLVVAVVALGAPALASAAGHLIRDDTVRSASSGASPSASTYSPSSTTVLPDGGHEYNFTVGGAPTHFIQPPAGFNPQTATSWQLAEYYPPEPPASSPGFTSWLTMVADGHFSHTPVTGATQLNLPANSRQGPNINASNNSGYVVNAPPKKNGADPSPRTYFNDAEIYYYQPADTGASCPGYPMAFWTGLGDFSSAAYGNGIGQAGSEINANYFFPGYSPYLKWYEVYPAGPVYPAVVNDGQAQNGQFWSATPDALQFFEVYYDGGGEWTFYTYDSGTQDWGTVLNATYPSSYYDGSTASANTETAYGTMSDFGVFDVYGAYQNWGYYTNLPYNALVQSNSGTTTLTGMNNDSGFDDYWGSC